MADSSLLRAFRFKVALRRSAGGESGKQKSTNTPAGDCARRWSVPGVLRT